MRNKAKKNCKKARVNLYEPRMSEEFEKIQMSIILMLEKGFKNDLLANYKRKRISQLGRFGKQIGVEPQLSQGNLRAYGSLQINSCALAFGG